MSRRLALSGLVIVALSVSQSVSAQEFENPFVSGNTYDRLCDSSNYVIPCTVFVMGVAEGYRLGTADRYICLPPKVDNGQLKAIGRKYIRDNPETAHLGAAQLLVSAWFKSFPCPKRPK